MANDLAGKKVAFLGAGKMGGILLQALLKNGSLSPKATRATVAHEERAKALSAKLNVKVGTNNVEAAKGADIIILAVKPQVVEEVVREISGHITPETAGSIGGSIGANFHDRKESAAECSGDSRHAQHSMPARSGNDSDLQGQARQQ